MKITITLVLGGCVMFAIFHNKKEVIPALISDNRKIASFEPIFMEFKYLGKADYMDNPHYYEMLMLEPGEPFTLSEIANEDRLLRGAEHGFKFIGPTDFDFDNYELLYVFGREIIELECVYDISGGYFMSITYNKDYKGNTVFFYQIEKRNYMPPDAYSKCFIMDGDEKVYIGNQYALVTFQKKDE